MSRSRYSPEEQAFYRAYINSPAWRARRAARIELADHQCEWVVRDAHTNEELRRCHRTYYLMVHHNTYERLGAELDSDLNVFCYFHHMLEHLFWRKCAMCQAPCLETEGLGERWLHSVLASLGIDIDGEAMPWSDLPSKEELLEYLGIYCPNCADYMDR